MRGIQRVWRAEGDTGTGTSGETEGETDIGGGSSVGSEGLKIR
jgi:hypothetical protein